MKESAKTGVKMWLKFIFQEMEDQGMTPYELAKKSMVPESTISRLKSGQIQSPTLETIFQLLGALEIYPFLTNDKEAIKGFTYINFN